MKKPRVVSWRQTTIRPTPPFLNPNNEILASITQPCPPLFLHTLATALKISKKSFIDGASSVCTIFAILRWTGSSWARTPKNRFFSFSPPLSSEIFSYDLKTRALGDYARSLSRTPSPRRGRGLNAKPIRDKIKYKSTEFSKGGQNRVHDIDFYIIERKIFSGANDFSHGTQPRWALFIQSDSECKIHWYELHEWRKRTAEIVGVAYMLPPPRGLNDVKVFVLSEVLRHGFHGLPLLTHGQWISRWISNKHVDLTQPWFILGLFSGRLE